MRTGLNAAPSLRLLALFVGSVLATESAVAAVPSTPSVKEVVERAARWVHSYADELPQFVATELMTQQVVLPPGSAAPPRRRTWRAEVGWVRVSGEAEPIAVRDVLEVDGLSVGGPRSRLVELLHGAARGSWSAIREVLDEGSRHNLASGTRNFNLPTVAIFFLHPERRERFSWKGRVPPDASRPIAVEFRERSRPTIVRGPRGESIFSKGRMHVDASGIVRRTELHLSIERTAYTLEASFDHVTEVGAHVPVEMTERYLARDGIVLSRASYTNYRRFQSGARLLP